MFVAPGYMAHYCDVVGIDLGTTRSSVAVWDGTQVLFLLVLHPPPWAVPSRFPDSLTEG